MQKWGKNIYDCSSTSFAPPSSSWKLWLETLTARMGKSEMFAYVGLVSNVAPCKTTRVAFVSFFRPVYCSLAPSWPECVKDAAHCVKANPCRFVRLPKIPISMFVCVSGLLRSFRKQCVATKAMPFTMSPCLTIRQRTTNCSCWTVAKHYPLSLFQHCLPCGANRSLWCQELPMIRWLWEKKCDFRSRCTCRCSYLE